MSFFCSEVGERGSSKRMIVVNEPGQFTRIERCLDLALNFLTQTLGQVVVRTILRVESRKERQTVFDDRTTDRSTGIDFRKSVRGQAREREVLGLTNKAARVAVGEDVAVEFVGSGLGDDVKYAA